MNLYGYVGNNPLNFTDLLGLSGYLTIHSGSDDEENSISGHSWIEYRNDDGTVTTYGTYGNAAGAQRVHGLNINTELGHVGDVSRMGYIDDTRETVLMNFVQRIADKGAKGWGYLCPCSAFASDTWTKVTGEKLQDRNWFGISNPNALSNAIRRLNGGKDYGMSIIRQKVPFSNSSRKK